MGLLLVFLGTASVHAEDRHPLKPIDTSSPRATLEGFMQAMDASYASYAMVKTYLASSQLYFTPSQLEALGLTERKLTAAQRVIDLSKIPEAVRQESSRLLVLQLKEILDRIELPAVESIPDAAAMEAHRFKRWTIPNTELHIALIESGDNAGEYLFTAQTVARIPEFYEKVRALPYRTLTSTGMYEFSAYSPAGIAKATYRFLPPRWILDLPDWTRSRVLGEPLWRWISTGLVLGLGLGVVMLSFRLSGFLSRTRRHHEKWFLALKPLSLVITAPILAYVIADGIRILGMAGNLLALGLWVIFYVALTWWVWLLGAAVAESVIRAEKLRKGSIDSQLIRLGIRLVTIALALAIMVEGANRVGLPAYSIVAGLGVGGLAVALAGQQTLANLLGSLIIMFEKPFKPGDRIMVKGVDGVVEEVGFRCTRIRTFYDSLVNIPSSEMVNSTIDNFERRHHKEIRTILNITYDTSLDKIRAFVEAIRHMLESHEETRKDNIQVGFYDFGPHSLDVHLKCMIKAPNRNQELELRQEILLNIIALAEKIGIRFAYPTQSLLVENWPDQGNKT